MHVWDGERDETGHPTCGGSVERRSISARSSAVSRPGTTRRRTGVSIEATRKPSFAATPTHAFVRGRNVQDCCATVLPSAKGLEAGLPRAIFN